MGLGRRSRRRTIAARVLTYVTNEPQTASLRDAVAEHHTEYVLVPRVPTEAMLKAAWADALAEDAGAVWESMIVEWKLFVEQNELGNR
jgi:hypothetical protein